MKFLNLKLMLVLVLAFTVVSMGCGSKNISTSSSAEIKLGDTVTTSTYEFDMANALIEDKGDGVSQVIAKETSNSELRLVGPIKLDYQTVKENDHQITINADVVLAIANAEHSTEIQNYAPIAKLSMAYSGTFND